ncbi:MAG: chromate efflux transporter [Anaerolineales bacterium]
MRELAFLFIRLGFTAFGGPAAHIGMLHNEVVVRRKWMSEQEFLDLLGATNLIPGPNSTEMVIHIGQRQAGWRGMLLAGLGFIIPAMLLVLGFAWLYVEYGSTPQAAWLLFGIKPVVIVLILHALWNLARTALKSLWLGLLGGAVLVLYFLGINEIFLLFAAAAFWMLIQLVRQNKLPDLKAILFPLGLYSWPLVLPSFSLGVLFLSFLKIGAVLYGSGYVLLTFLRAEFVDRLAWITDQQLLDAVAVGQVTPGPLFTSATFIGYIVGGLPGGLVATLGIFLPSFLFVWLSAPWIPRIRSSPWSSAFLDGVNMAALGLMAAVTWQLGAASLVDIPSISIALVAALLLFQFRLNSFWLVLAGGLAGLLISLIQ